MEYLQKTNSAILFVLKKLLQNQHISLFLVHRYTAISRDERLDVELSLAPVIVHVSNLAENRTLSPALIVCAANRPHAAHIS